MIVCGAGTGGTVCGIGKKVKEVAPNCKVRMCVCILFKSILICMYVCMYVCIYYT